MFLGVLVAIKVLGNWFVPINVASGEMVEGGRGGDAKTRRCRGWCGGGGGGGLGKIMRPRVQEG